MVRGGRVTINGQVKRNAQTRADPFRDQIMLDGQPLPLDNACRYLLLNKPYGVLCAFTDPEGEREDERGEREDEREDERGEREGEREDEREDERGEREGERERRPTLADYVDVPDVYAAGRLDLDSEGLLLLTNDGWLIHRLSHPHYSHPKTYLVQVEQVPRAEALTALRRGVLVKGRRTAPAQAEVLPDEPDLPPRPVPIRTRKTVPTAWLRMVLTEGQKRQVRRMTAAVGHPTLRLIRVGIGPLELGSLKPGEWREITPGELDALRATLGQKTGR
jgi:23S rRNA pseudouridine2457 synthase